MRAFSEISGEFEPVLDHLLLIDTPEGPLGPIDFRALGVREFGTIYEGLLESELSVADVDLTLDAKGNYVPRPGHQPIEVPAGASYLHNRSGARKSSANRALEPGEGSLEGGTHFSSKPAPPFLPTTLT